MPNTPPQGPALLASRLREYGANPLILDLNSYRFIKENTKDEYRVLTFDEAEKLLFANYLFFFFTFLLLLASFVTSGLSRLLVFQCSVRC